MLKTGFLLALFTLFGFLFFDDQSPALSPEDEFKTFQIADGYNVELVASEPLVQEPVFIKFDDKGRLWVVEMRAFMPDVEGTGEEAPTGRVVYLEDSNNDGQFDKKTIYADGLVLPRALQFYPDGVLISENIPLWFYEDTDGDGISDKRTLVDSTYGNRGLPEHSPNGLLMNKDNWLYNAKSSLRYRREGDHWITDTTEFRGQWGIAKDDFGRLFYNYNWSQLHTDLVPPNYLNRNPAYKATTGIDYGMNASRQVFPAGPTPAVNRGYIPGVLTDEGKLAEFTSACAPYIHREKEGWPADFLNNALVCEPAGNLIKRNKLVLEGNYLNAENAYPDFDFWTSTDMRFRPVFITSGPDGAIYIADMYRGINQHGAYLTDYLKEQTVKRGLDKTLHLGRIWRLTPKGFKGQKALHIQDQDPEKLVELLNHPAAYYRDISQRILLENSEKASIKALEKLATSTKAMPTARVNAIWILDHLSSLNAQLCLNLLEDKDPEVFSNALILLEKKALKNQTVQTQLEKALGKQTKKEVSDRRALQILLSSNAYSEKFAIDVVAKLIHEKGEDALLRDAALSALSGRELPLMKKLLTDPRWQEELSHQAIFLEQLAGIIFNRREPKETEGFLDLIDKTDAWPKTAMLQGARMQAMASEEEPINLDKKPAIFDEQLEIPLEALAAAYAWPGKPIEKKSEAKKKALDAAALKQFASGRQSFLTYCSGCHGANGKGVQRFAPPLAGSEWVLGDQSRLGLILLHGIEGPIDVKGKRYDEPEIQPVMPAHSGLSDGDLANILTYIRNEWGNDADPIGPRTIGRLRLTHQGKVVPWTPDELNEHVEKLNSKP
ncbi:c-type cytochrome [Marinilongibacter aquaticus]|uniref:DUF7133 domain-containing protein n=1 Tax=Marinilongibacter aquaticus TaxID=2975157 RepID=UPI0021BDDE60|nr:c-type cytochrome [Marinilongibacter aquaticus]UBM58950.1 c-type cytochrome [Marinilongibacter aquaticus]